jgi:hypothetical protein
VARAAADAAGSGLSVGAIRWSARSLREVALPADHRAWAQGAELLGRIGEASDADAARLLRALGAAMCRAHGVAEDHPVLDWWVERAIRS